MKMEICLLSHQLLSSASVFLVSKGRMSMGREGNFKIRRTFYSYYHPDDQRTTLVVAYRVLQHGWEHKPMGNTNFQNMDRF